jgi:hypothetical protein
VINFSVKQLNKLCPSEGQAPLALAHQESNISEILIKNNSGGSGGSEGLNGNNSDDAEDI